jgi:RNA polymerase sigma-70 factor, ECF subfamily
MKDAIKEKYWLYRAQTRKDPQAYAQLYDTYVTSIYRFVYFKVNDHEDAEDLTADVFLKAWNYITEHSDVRSFRAVIYRIARNLVIDLYRRRATRNEVTTFSNDDDEQAEDRSTHFSDKGAGVKQIESAHDHQQVLDAIGQLKEEYREVVLFRYVDGLSASEVAEILGRSSVDVRVTTHRAMKALRKILKVE